MFEGFITKAVSNSVVKYETEMKNMKRTILSSLGMCAIMGALVLVLPFLAAPRLVLRFLPKDVYEAGKDHPAPSRKRQLLGHLLTAAFCGYITWAYKDNINRIKQEKLSFGQAFCRLMVFLLIEKAFDIAVLDQYLCMTSGYYKRFYPETAGCEGWHDRSWNSRQQGVRLLLYPVICTVQAYLLTRNKKIS